MVNGNDSTIRGGTNNPYTLRKALRAQEIAQRNRLPLINLVESGGADLPTQADQFVPGGAMFRNLTRLSSLDIPTLALVFGSSTAGGAYVPGLCDHTVFVRDRARVFLGGPPLVKMATGEEADAEELGGAEMHSRTSGLSDYLAADEHDALRLGRDIVRRLNWRKLGPGPSEPADAPLYDPEELLGVMSADRKVPFDPGDLLARDPRRLALRRVQAALRHGALHRLGVAARLSDRRPRQRARRPLLGGGAEGRAVHPARQPARRPAAVRAQHDRLHGRQGVRAGRDRQARRADDQRGLELQGPAPVADRRRLLRRRQLRDVRARLRPALRVRLAERADRGDGPAAARRRALDRRAKASAETRGLPFDEEEDERMREAVEDQIEREQTALANSGRGYDDGIIDPRDTRTVLGLALSVIHNAPVAGSSGFGVFRL